MWTLWIVVSLVKNRCLFHSRVKTMSTAAFILWILSMMVCGVFIILSFYFSLPVVGIMFIGGWIFIIVEGVRDMTR